jgi:hypothetical protein
MYIDIVLKNKIFWDVALLIGRNQPSTRRNVSSVTSGEKSKQAVVPKRRWNSIEIRDVTTQEIVFFIRVVGAMSTSNPKVSYSP